MIELYCVISPDRIELAEAFNPIMFCSTIKQECHDYINDRLNHGENEAAKYVVRTGRMPEPKGYLR